MSKIVCDICGTTYPDTAQCCPICGCVREPDTGYKDDLLEGNGRIPGKKKGIFDFDEVNSESEPELDMYSDEDDTEETYEEEDYEEYEEDSGHSTLLVILLTVLIAGLLLVAGFIFVRFFLPNRNKQEVAPATTVVATQMWEDLGETTEPTVPCDTLTIFSGMKAELSAEGQYFLLNVKAMPENTTDKILYISGDESIATVSEDGRITAVSEGETTVFISCGKISQECPVIVKYVEETEPPTTEAETEATEEAEEMQEQSTEPEDAEEQTQATEGVTNTDVDPNVVLKLKKTDIMLGVYYQFTLELDCDLEQNQVQWSSEHPHIATVDENGVVTAIKSGTTSITAKYGDQEVHCMVRCG